MAQAFPLGLQVAAVVGIGGHDHGDPPGDRDPLAAQALDLVRVVREQGHGTDLEQTDDVRRGPVLPGVAGKTQPRIGVHRVRAQVLQVVGLELVEQTDAPPLLTQVDDRAGLLPLDVLQALLQLLAAVAAQGGPDVAGVALRVDPHRAVLPAVDIPLHERGVLLPVGAVQEPHDYKLSEASRQARAGHPFHGIIGPAVSDGSAVGRSGLD